MSQRRLASARLADLNPVPARLEPNVFITADNVQETVIDAGLYTREEVCQGIAATSGVLLVPAGRYIVSQRLEIEKSHFVLRGEGAGRTILHFPHPLGQLYGQDWSFSGGFITVKGTDPGPVLATVSGNAGRGSTTLPVATTAGIQVGDWVRVVQTDSAGTLFASSL